MAGDKENPLPPEGQGEGAPAVEGATKMFSMKLDGWLSDFSPGDLLGEGAPAAPADAPLVEPLDIAPVATAPVALIPQAPRVIVPGLIPPPDAPPAARASSPDLLADPLARISRPDLPAARISRPDLPAARASSPDLLADPLARISRPDLPGAAAPTIDPLGPPTIDPLGPPIVVSPAPPPGVSAAAMMIGLPGEQHLPARRNSLVLRLLLILFLVSAGAAAYVFFGDKIAVLLGR
jgi:hypothetical protein